MGDRVAVLKDGYLQQLALPQTLYDRPANGFVASFMGSRDESVRRVDLGARGEREGLGRLLQAASAPAGARRRRPALAGGDKRGIIVGIRPESLTVPDGAPPVEGC